MSRPHVRKPWRRVCDFVTASSDEGEFVEQVVVHVDLLWRVTVSIPRSGCEVTSTEKGSCRELAMRLQRLLNRNLR